MQQKSPSFTTSCDRPWKSVSFWTAKSVSFWTAQSEDGYRGYQNCANDFLNCKKVVLAVGCISLFHYIIIWDNTDRRASGQDVLLFGTIAHRLCLTVYMVEFGLRCFVERLRVVQSAWNWLDIIIISADITSEMFKLCGRDFSMGGLQALRVFKVSRFIGWFKELRMLIQGIVGSLRILFWSFILLFTFSLGWATLLVELVHPLMDDVRQHTSAWNDCNICPRSFSSVWAASLTLFQSANAGDSWGKVAIPVIERYPFTAIIFVGSQFTLIVGVLNIIVAVLVDGAAEARARDTSQRAQEAIRQEITEKKVLEKIFKRIDVDGSGVLRFPDLVRGVEKVPELQERLQVMDIQGADLHELFMMLDGDGSGEVDPKEFIDTLYRMRCGDDRTAATFVKHYVVHMKKDQATIAEKVGEIELNMNELRNLHERTNNEAIEKDWKLSSFFDPSHVKLMPCSMSSHVSQRETNFESKNSSVGVVTTRASPPSPLVSTMHSPGSSAGRELTRIVAPASAEIERSDADMSSERPRRAGPVSPRKPQFVTTPRPDTFDANFASVEIHAMQEHVMIMVRQAETCLRADFSRLMHAQMNHFKDKIQTLTHKLGHEGYQELDSALGLFGKTLAGQIDTRLKKSLAPIHSLQDIGDHTLACTANIGACTPRSHEIVSNTVSGASMSRPPAQNALPSVQFTEQPQPQDAEIPRDVHVYLVKHGSPSGQFIATESLPMSALFSSASSSYRTRSESPLSHLQRGTLKFEDASSRGSGTSMLGRVHSSKMKQKPSTGNPFRLPVKSNAGSILE